MNYQDIYMQVWTLLSSTFGAALIPIVIPLYIWMIHSRTNRDMFGKVVLITGASSGLGEQLAHVFYRAGCKLILAARRVDQLERVKAELLAIKTKRTTFPPDIVQMDLSDLGSLPGKAQEALRFCGQVDILINNGGISFRGGILETTVEVHMKVMMVNYFGQITLTKALLPSMIEKKQGHIVVISSVQGKIAIPNRSAYAASKHALQAFFDCLRAEVSRHGVQVTVASPGYINTSLSVNALTGSGTNYAVMDETTAKGYDAREVALRVYQAVSRQQKELTIAPLTPRIAIILRHFFPTLFFYLMKRRAQKEA